MSVNSVKSVRPFADSMFAMLAGKGFICRGPTHSMMENGDARDEVSIRLLRWVRDTGRRNPEVVAADARLLDELGGTMGYGGGIVQHGWARTGAGWSLPALHARVGQRRHRVRQRRGTWQERSLISGWDGCDMRRGRGPEWMKDMWRYLRSTLNASGQGRSCWARRSGT